MIADYHHEFMQFCARQKVDGGKLIADALQTYEGSKLLEALNKFTPLLDNSFHPDSRFQSHHSGRLEVLQLLWRYGTKAGLPERTQPQQPHASEETRTGGMPAVPGAPDGDRKTDGAE